MERLKSVMIHIRIPAELDRRVRYTLFTYGDGRRGNLTQFVVDALDEKLQRVLDLPLTFEQAFRREYPQMTLHAKVKVECYGGWWLTPKEGEPWRPPTPHFTLAGLREHFETSRWDGETYGLIEEQLRLHADAGLAASKRLLVPPKPKEPGAAEGLPSAHCPHGVCASPLACDSTGRCMGPDEED